MSMNFKMLAKTLYGFEPLLAKELRNLGASHVKEGVRNVTFEGDLGFMYKANLNLRTALNPESAIGKKCLPFLTLSDRKKRV